MVTQNIGPTIVQYWPCLCVMSCVYAHAFFIVRLFMYCRWRSNYQEVGGWYALNRLSSSYIGDCPKTLPGFPTPLSWRGVLHTLCDVCERFSAGIWFSLGTPVPPPIKLTTTI